MSIVKSIRLFYQEGSSDKLYCASILEDGGAYSVKVEWGRRGSKLNEGKKAVKVPLAAAEKTFERLVREKTGKGYQPITDDVQPAAVAPPEGEGSGSKVGGKRAKVGYAAQLLNSIRDDELERFLRDDTYVAQQKLDGHRAIAHVGDGDVLATNRAGQKTEVPRHLLDGLSSLPAGTVVDGEVVAHEAGHVYWLFDVLAVGGRDVTALGYTERWEILDGELEPGLSGPVRVLAVAEGYARKKSLHDRLAESKAEGIVFKDRKAPYKSGRPASGGTQRKHKFVKSADVVLLSNAGNAYQMGVWDRGKLVHVGKVFAGTTNESRKLLDELLASGDRPVAEVRYLYATEDDQLYQPVFVRVRDDKAGEECLRTQLTRTNRTAVDD
jgi:bifunctional non-homologous end joining protein LigD